MTEIEKTGGFNSKLVHTMDHQRVDFIKHLCVTPEIEQQLRFSTVFLQQEIFKGSRGERVGNYRLNVGAVASPVAQRQPAVSRRRQVTH